MRSWAEPIVRLLQSVFDDSVADREKIAFLQRKMNLLEDVKLDHHESPGWMSELNLTLDNLEAASIAISGQRANGIDSRMSLPSLEEAAQWFAITGPGVVRKGSVDRYTAARLLVLISDGDEKLVVPTKEALDLLLRHVEIRRQACIRLIESSDPLERWYEIHDTAILFARSACQLGELRTLNAALKLNDWAMPVHRRSVPVELLVRYLLSLSETFRACEVLL